MTPFPSRRSSTIRTRSSPNRAHRPWHKRKRDFQHWLFNLTLAIMGLLVLGFVISALTTRSGVEVTITKEDLAESTRMLTVPPGSMEREGFEADVTEDRIEIEVLNGCGVPGMAGEFTDFLRSRGYDVVRFTNAQRYDYPRTLVVSRSADFARARLVAQSLGVESNAVENMPDPSLQLDVTVVLGLDYSTLTSYRELMSSRR